MTVANKMILLVLTAVLGLIGLAWMGQNRMEAVYEKTNYTNINSVPSIVTMGEAAENFGRLRVRVYRHVLNTDAAAMSDIEVKLKESQDGIASALKKYETDGMISDDKDRQLLADDAAAYNEYLNGVEKVLVLSRLNKTEQARDVLTQYAGAAEKVNAALKAHSEYNVTLAKKASEEAVVAKTDAARMSTIVAALVVLFTALLGFFITRGITRPLNEAVNVANKLAEGDLTVNIEVTSTDEMGRLLTAMKNMTAKLSQIISEVNSAATNIASASEEVSSTAQSMSQATNEQAASVEQTSAAVEEMGASINQNTENAKVTEGIAANAAKDANEGGEAVSQTVAAMKQIADKISIIDDIAYQTNLLALNAAIEAARAGEHGRGFAVVAAEVRKLAERSQVAAQEIGEVAKSSVGLAEKAGHLLEEMVPNINKTSDLVQEITAASEEQSTGAGQITSAINQLNQITQQNASSSEELAATAEEMSASAEQLQGLMSFFTLNDSAAGQVRQVAPAKQTAKKAFKPAKTTLARNNTDVDEGEFVKF